MDNHIIPIDSIFRNHIKFENSNNFTYYLPEALKNISYVRISSIELPKLNPHFTSALVNNSFEVSKAAGEELVSTEMLLDDKYYSNIDDLVTDINTKLTAIKPDISATTLEISKITASDGLTKIQISSDENITLDFSTSNHPYTYQERETVYSNITKKQSKDYKLSGNLYYDEANQLIYRYKVTTINTLNEKNTSFLTSDVLDTSILTNHNSNLGKNNKNFNIKIPCLGYYLGFRKKFYSGSDTYVAEAEPQLDILNYMLVKVNNYGRMLTNHNDSEYLGKVILQSNQKTNDNESNLLSKRYVLNKPTDISELDISLHDPYGNLLNTSNLDYTLTLELGMINNADLKNQFRESFP